MYRNPRTVVAVSEGATFDNSKTTRFEAPTAFLLGHWENRDWRNVSYC